MNMKELILTLVVRFTTLNVVKYIVEFTTLLGDNVATSDRFRN